MHARKSSKKPAQVAESYSADEFKNDLAENKNFLTGPLSQKLSSNLFITAVSLEYDVEDSVVNVVNKFMLSLEGNYASLYQLSEEKAYEEYSVATQATCSVNFYGLDALLRQLPSSERLHFANHVETEGRWKGFSMVHHAVFSGRLDKLKLLHRCGANLEAKVNAREDKLYHGWDVLDIAIRQWFVNQDNKETVRTAFELFMDYMVRFLRHKNEDLTANQILIDIRKKHKYLTESQLVALNNVISTAHKTLYVPPEPLEKKSIAKRGYSTSDSDFDTSEQPAKRIKTKSSKEDEEKESSKSKTKGKSKVKSRSSSLATMTALHSASSKPKKGKEEKKAEPIEFDPERMSQLEAKNAELLSQLSASRARVQKVEADLAEHIKATDSRFSAMGAAFEEFKATHAKSVQQVNALQEEFKLFSAKSVDRDARTDSIEKDLRAVQATAVDLDKRTVGLRSEFSMFGEKVGDKVQLANARLDALEARNTAAGALNFVADLKGQLAAAQRRSTEFEAPASDSHSSGNYFSFSHSAFDS